jgi:jagged-like protein
MGDFGCAFGSQESVVFSNYSSFALNESSIQTISLSFSFRWTINFSMILQATDFQAKELIEEVPYSNHILPNPIWTNLDNSLTFRNAKIKYRIRVICAENYYNDTCTTLCKPRSDLFGHFRCDENGEKICLEGWQGSNCETPICKENCSIEHGFCKSPGKCECSFGWQGKLSN